MSHFHKSVIFATFLTTCILFSQLTSVTSEEDQEFSFSSAWEIFWSVSCEFSDLLESESSRSKRSLHQEPNFEDPLELFNYLYPLADVKPEDYTDQQQRSSAHPFLTTWLQDLVDLWGSECHSRHSPREKRDADHNHSPHHYSEDEMEDDLFQYEADTNTGGSENTFRNSTTTTPAPAKAVKKEKKVIADVDTFFAQYGGDIEYFFPLISFGIPFDGEITFLGFHGFKGLFPYK